MLEFLISIDRAVFLFFNSTISNPPFDYFFTYITHRDNWIIPGIVAATIFIVKEKKKACIVLLLLAITAAITDPFCVRVLKPLFHRLRPCHPSYFVDGKHIFLAGGHFLLGYKKSLSFPSAHAMNMFAGATLLAFLYPKRIIWFFSFGIPIAFSRIYIGVHYPFDSITGAVLGSGIGASVFYLYSYGKRKLLLKRSNPDSKIDE